MNVDIYADLPDSPRKRMMTELNRNAYEYIADKLLAEARIAEAFGQHRRARAMRAEYQRFSTLKDKNA